ncbi:MAG: hypothetical protein AAF600_16630 [Bacteroidota bacterium]
MRPKLNKLITLLLLLGTFAFLTEAEERVTSLAKEELSKWASLLPEDDPDPQEQTLNPYANSVSIRQVILSSLEKEKQTAVN